MTMVDYTCHRIRTPMKVDGNLTKSVWEKAPRSPRFVDMVTGDPAFFDTRAAALWDSDNLYIGFGSKSRLSRRISQNAIH